MEVGSIEYLATINTKNYKKGADDIVSANKKIEGSTENVDSKGNKAMGNIGNAAKTAGRTVAAGLAVAGTAITGLLVTSIKGYAEYEQLVGGVDTLFKNSSQTVQTYAENAYKTAGLSANAYMETITGFSASLLQGLGGDTEKAAQIGNMAVTDMSDNANKMGTSIEMIQNAYQGFAKDNFTMLDNLKLGYGGTAGEMARLVNDSGVLGDSFEATAENVKDIPFDQLITAIHTVQDEMGITGTTAKEASETISGSFSSMTAAWSNLVTGMANPDADVGKLLSHFLDSVDTFGKNLIPALDTALEGVVGIIDGVGSKLIEALPGLLETLLPRVIDTFINLVTVLVESLPDLIPVLVKGFGDLLKGLLRAIPIVLPSLIKGVISLILGVVSLVSDPEMLSLLLDAALTLFLAIVQAIPEIVVALVEALPQIIDSLITFFTDPKTIVMVIGAWLTLMGAFIDATPKILGALVRAFGDLLGRLWGRLTGMFSDGGAKIGKAVADGFKGAVNTVLRWIGDRINTFIDMINSAVNVINKVPGVNIGKIGRMNIPQLAEGGIVSSATLAVIGEGREPEAVIPLSKLDKMLSDNNAPSGNSNSYDININVSGAIVTSSQDQRKFAEVIGKRLNEIMTQKGYKPSIQGV